MVDIYLWQPLFTLDNKFALHMDCLAASSGRLKSPLLQASRSRGAAQQSVAESGECGGGVPNQVILYICPSIYTLLSIYTSTGWSPGWRMTTGTSSPG